MGRATDEAKRDALALLSALDRQDAVLYAEKAEALVVVAELFTGQDDPAAPYLKLDIALELQIAPATATSRIAQARHLVFDLPQTLTALKLGEAHDRTRDRAGQGDHGPDPADVPTGRGPGHPRSPGPDPR